MVPLSCRNFATAHYVIVSLGAYGACSVMRPSPLVVALQLAVVALLQSPQRPEAQAASPAFEEGLAAMGRGDVAAARERLQAAAEAGHVRASAVLGSGLIQGTLGPGAPAEGVRWLTFAAERGDTDAQHDLGVALYSGATGDRNEAGAFRWFKEAAEAGHPEAAYNVGAFYDDGIVVSKDEAQAAEWYRKAVGREVVEAMHTLAMMHATGRGVARDIQLAAELLARAKEHGDADIDDDIDELLRILPPTEKSELEAALRR
jgi:TPR repeat protein